MKTKIVIALIALLTSITSCSEDTFDVVGNDGQNPDTSGNGTTQIYGQNPNPTVPTQIQPTQPEENEYDRLAIRRVGAISRKITIVADDNSNLTVLDSTGRIINPAITNNGQSLGITINGKTITISRHLGDPIITPNCRLIISNINIYSIVTLTEFEYDTNGMETRRTIVETNIYGSTEKITIVTTDPSIGAITEDIYNSSGALTSKTITTTDPVTGVITKDVYNGSGALTSKTITTTDPVTGVITKDVYNGSGALTSKTITTTDPVTGAITEDIYNGSGSLTGTTITDPNSNTETDIDYDENSNPIYKHIYEYHASGNITKVTLIDLASNASYNCQNQTYIPIITAEGLQNIDIGKKYCLAEDIDLSSISNFRPITTFSGILDGEHHTITGLNINRPNTNSIGLFNTIEKTGVVRKLIIKNPTVKGKDVVGALVGINKGTIIMVEIKSDNATAIVSGSKYAVGGLAGENDFNAITKQSHSEVNVEARNEFGRASFVLNGSIGGLVGYNDGNILDSYATGDVKAPDIGDGQRGIGGLVGYSNWSTSKIHKCHATGDVEGSNYVGGLVGYNDAEKLEDNYATGDVKGNDSVGGLVGHNSGEKLEDNYATGDVNGNDNVGGLVGYNNNNKYLSFNRASGKVIGNNYVGGLVGKNYISSGGYGDKEYRLSYNYATGDVEGNDNVGGILGAFLGDSNYSPQYERKYYILYIYATGNVKGNDNVGGLAGQLTGYSNNMKKLAGSYATGYVDGNGNNVGGLVGAIHNGTIIENCYFDTATTNQANGIGNDSSNTGVTGIRAIDIDGGGEEPFKSTGRWELRYTWSAEGDGQWPKLGWQP